MLTQAQVLEAIKGGKESQTLDGRDYARLCDFFPVADWEALGFKLKDGAEPKPPKPWTQEAVVAQLAEDLAFGFEKALNRRGISASLMYETVKMWMWVLDDAELRDFDSYAQYGLPLFKAVAIKYGLPNAIGDDDGDDYKYSTEAEW